MNAAFFKVLADPPWWPLLLTGGFAAIASGVIEATRAVCQKPEEDLGLPGATFTWSDYYASADPVSNGPLASDDLYQQHQPAGCKPPLLPRPCNEVYNSGSVTFDHNGYLRNQSELLPSLLNDLVAAAYGNGDNSSNRPELVCPSDVTASSQHRRRLLRWLVAARVAAIALLATLVWADPGRVLKHPMEQLMHAFAAPAGMSNDTAIRLLAAALITAAFYVMAVIAWRAALRHSVRLFFHTPFPTAVARPDPEIPANQVAMSGLSSGTA